MGLLCNWIRGQGCLSRPEKWPLPPRLSVALRLRENSVELPDGSLKTPICAFSRNIVTRACPVNFDVCSALFDCVQMACARKRGHGTLD